MIAARVLDEAVPSSLEPEQEGDGNVCARDGGHGRKRRRRVSGDTRSCPGGTRTTCLRRARPSLRRYDVESPETRGHALEERERRKARRGSWRREDEHTAGDDGPVPEDLRPHRGVGRRACCWGGDDTALRHDIVRRAVARRAVSAAVSMGRPVAGLDPGCSMNCASRSSSSLGPAPGWSGSRGG